MHMLLFRSQFLACFKFNVSINQIVGYIHLFLVKLLNSSFSRNMLTCLLFAKFFKPVEATSCTSILRFFMLFKSPFLVKSTRFPRIFFSCFHPDICHSRNGVPCPKYPEIKKVSELGNCWDSWDILGWKQLKILNVLKMLKLFFTSPPPTSHFCPVELAFWHSMFGGCPSPPQCVNLLFFPRVNFQVPQPKVNSIFMIPQ